MVDQTYISYRRIALLELIIQMFQILPRAFVFPNLHELYANLRSGST